MLSRVFASEIANAKENIAERKRIAMSTFSDRCRHTFATMLSAQVPAHILAKLMRNDIRVTQKYYLHEDNEVLLNEVNRALG